MTQLSLYTGDRRLDLNFAPPTNPTEVDGVVTQARKDLAKFETGLTSLQLDAFEQNLRSWIQDGKADGLISVNRALDGSVPTARTPVALQFHAAHEIELRGTELTAPKLGYSDQVAKTGTDVGAWDLFALTADQVNKAHTQGCIEVVFAKHAAADATELNRRATVMGLLNTALAENSGGKLQGAVDAFNLALEAAAKKDPGLAKYKLNHVSADVDVAVKGTPFYSTQTNLEVDLRKLGDLTDTTIPALFQGPHHADDKAMFIEARAQANTLVDEVFRDTAATLHGGRFQKDSIKLDKLRGTFTLMLYSTAKVKQMGSKGAWPVLPKAGAADLIRETFNTRDKLTLFAHTSDPKKYAALEKRLMEATKAVKATRSFGKAIGTEKNFDFAGAKRSEKEAMEFLFGYLLKPGQNPNRYGKESTCYGKVDWSDQSYAGTITGKPIQTTYNETRRNLACKHPKVVLEVRRMDNPINATVETQAKKATPDFAATQGFKDLTAAASPWLRARAPKAAV
jgi:hypothetical protein